jgi:hypothetical protein
MQGRQQRLVRRGRHVHPQLVGLSTTCRVTFKAFPTFFIEFKPLAIGIRFVSLTKKKKLSVYFALFYCVMTVVKANYSLGRDVTVTSGLFTE